MEAQREKARAGKVGLVGAQLNRHGSDPAVLGPLPLQMGQDRLLPSSQWQGGSPAQSGPGLPASVLLHGEGFWGDSQHLMASVGQSAASWAACSSRAGSIA